MTGSCQEKQRDRRSPGIRPSRHGAAPERRASDDRRPELPRRDFSAQGPDDFGLYRDIYSIGSTVSRTEGPFRAAVTGFRFPGMPLFSRHLAGVIHERDAARVRIDDFDHINVQVLRRGTLAAGRPGEERAMRPGDVVVFDTTQPQRTIVERADYVTVSIPREALGASWVGVRRLHGTVLPAAVAGLLGDILLSLGLHAHTLDDRLAARSAALVRDFLTGIIDASVGGGAEQDELSPALEAHRWRAEAYIEAHLHDRRLDADRVAKGIGLSRSTLYAAFAPVNGVARRILLRRLARLRLALLDPGETRGIADLSFEAGFADESHCSRAFKAAYGLPPGRYRDEGRLDLAARSTGGEPSWTGLWRDVL